MYIDTHTKKSMEFSICDYLHISVKELSNIFDRAGKAADMECYFDGSRFDKVINEFICSKLPNISIDHILFFHLTRRLNAEHSLYHGNNLFDLLSTENTVSDFLKKYDVEFFPDEGHLNLWYMGKMISLENTEKEHVPYLRWRLGHNKGRIDFCFNGFAFYDLLYKNSYARELYSAPEFIRVLAAFLKRPEIISDFFTNSKYYCLEYCIPLDRVLFDNNDKLPIDEKRKYLLNQVLHRLYDYKVQDIKYIFDNDNPVIRLTDNDTMQEEFCISRTEITIDMLKR
ncbi:MAG: hypothetical protein ACYDEX_08110 [Mobilitalea sp.]